MATTYERFCESDAALEAALEWAANNPAEVLEAFLATDAGDVAYRQWCIDEIDAHIERHYAAERQEGALC